RLTRALHKLRARLISRGTVLAVDGLSSAIGAIATAPRLAQTMQISKTALAGGVQGRAFNLANHFVRMTRLAALARAAAMIAGMVLIVGAVTVAAQRTTPHALTTAPSPPTTAPATLEIPRTIRQ